MIIDCTRRWHGKLSLFENQCQPRLVNIYISHRQCMFVCLEFTVPLENFSLIWIRLYYRWRASNFDLCSGSEGSLTCHTYCDTGLHFIISEDPWHSPLLPSVLQWSCHNLFLRLRSVATGDRTPISRMRGERSTSTPPRR